MTDQGVPEETRPPIARRAPVSVTAALFTPSEAERITLVDVRQQREWRRHGYLPSQATHARFDLFGLAYMRALYVVAVRTGPLLAKSIAYELGKAMASNVLIGVDAYEGDHHRVGEWDREAWERSRRVGGKVREVFARMRPGEIEQAMAEAEQIKRDDPGPTFNSIGWLRESILRTCGLPTAKPPDFLIWWADGSHEFVDDLNTAFGSGLSNDPRFDGAPMVLDVGALAAGLIDRAGRAFYHVEIEDGAAGDD